uniref:Putative secreted protein n=1 Tax=Anopheles darlingi TaxID=43151 RepID=A0A2M4DRL7_ANODA
MKMCAKHLAPFLHLTRLWLSSIVSERVCVCVYTIWLCRPVFHRTALAEVTLRSVFFFAIHHIISSSL